MLLPVIIMVLEQHGALEAVQAGKAGRTMQVRSLLHTHDCQ
jgi:hypothetical protein